MKILIIDENINVMGGVERVLSTISNSLCNNHEVSVYSKFKTNDVPFYDYNNKVNLKYYISRKKSIKNLIIGKLNLKFLYKKRIIKDIINLKPSIIIFGRVQMALEVLPLLEKYKFNCKIIVRDAINLHFYNNEQKELLKKYFPYMVNQFIVSSKESYDEYTAFFNESSIKIDIIYNPIGIVPNVKYCYDNHKIISLGRMDDDQKGFGNLIKAMVIVHQKYQKWTLDIYGQGNLKEKFEQLIKDNNAETYIKILNPTKNVVKVFNESSIFVLASRYEGYANILVEALACGIPSISYNWYTGVEDIIDDNKNGLIVKLNNRDEYYNGRDCEENAQFLAKRIEELIVNKNLCDLLSNEAQNIIINRNIETIIKKWIRIIESGGN